MPRIFTILTAVLSVTAIGCRPADDAANNETLTTGTTVEARNNTGDSTTVDNHEDDHGHHHSHGDHGGEIVVLEPGDLEVEWVGNSDSGELVVHTDRLGDKKVETVVVEIQGAGEPKSYTLEAGEENIYRLTNAEMVTAIDASHPDEETMKSEVVVTIDGAVHRGRLINFH